MRQKPTVLAREIVASSRLFRVEEVQLRFSNGVERTYERLVGRGNGYGAVMIVAMIDAEQKAAKLMVDSWNVRRTTDEGTVADGTNRLSDYYVGNAVAKLLAGIGAA